MSRGGDHPGGICMSRGAVSVLAEGRPLKSGNNSGSCFGFRGNFTGYGYQLFLLCAQTFSGFFL